MREEYGHMGFIRVTEAAITVKTSIDELSHLRRILARPDRVDPALFEITAERAAVLSAVFSSEPEAPDSP
jgi:hypothetical protein